MKSPVNLNIFQAQKLFAFWVRYSRAFYSLMFFLTFGLGLSVWYFNVYRGDWSEEQKRSYAATAFQETEFRESAFEAAVQTTAHRAELHDTSVKVSRDLFFSDGRKK
ncbi:MAG: hypothetical protein HGA31_03785 [Candidatus Moranbacteria bacterium]|nr:hypothetical protein [Candidatus Moranbacteria bacterium]